MDHRLFAVWKQAGMFDINVTSGYLTLKSTVCGSDKHMGQRNVLISTNTHPLINILLVLHLLALNICLDTRRLIEIDSNI
jgi:hypothetical protein